MGRSCRRVGTPLGEFASVTAAGEAHGVSASAIHTRLRLGREGYAYIDDDDDERWFDDPYPAPVYEPATLRCLGCGGEFESWDRVRNRMCPACLRRGGPADDDWE